jgi:hypothetical protein
MYARVGCDPFTPPFQRIFTLVSTVPESHGMKVYMGGVRGFAAVRAPGESAPSGEVNNKGQIH